MSARSTNSGAGAGAGAGSAPSLLAVNLRHLCHVEGSVSRTCKQLGINRQQFNRYLAGTTVPSGGVIRRICDHFGIDEAELQLSPSRFRQLFRTKHLRSPSAVAREVLRRLERLEAFTGSQLKDYEGVWWSYYPSFSQPGRVLKSLVWIQAAEGAATFRSVERLPASVPGLVTPAGGAIRRFRYEGVVLFLRERIFLVGHETTANGEIVEMVLFPAYARGAQQLHGIIAGCSARATREPVAANVLLLRASPGPNDRRSALRQCGLFTYDDPAVPDVVRVALQMKPDASNLLRARADLGQSQ
jgi:transcriptional regulator with XRE-family HTH domain